jgi:hypothetical protein
LGMPRWRPAWWAWWRARWGTTGARAAQPSRISLGIRSVLQYLCKFSSWQIDTDRFVKVLVTEGIRYR